VNSRIKLFLKVPFTHLTICRKQGCMLPDFNSFACWMLNILMLDYWFTLKMNFQICMHFYHCIEEELAFDKFYSQIHSFFSLICFWTLFWLSDLYSFWVLKEMFISWSNTFVFNWKQLFSLFYKFKFYYTKERHLSFQILNWLTHMHNASQVFF
jgi:hypothetical protein